ncbi:MAG: SIS domain-containing protein, partial [Elusimicrobia bacterium]|nr:SIS domain-containing protein [Elusimicrobiota bacterium]
MTKTDKEILKTAKSVLKIEGRAVNILANQLDAAFVRAVKLMAGCKGRVVVLGVGKSGLVGRKIASTLSGTGTAALFAHPVECLHGDMGMMSAQDIALALSYSGETDELTKLIPLLKKRGLKVISLTGKARSKLSE